MPKDGRWLKPTYSIFFFSCFAAIDPPYLKLTAMRRDPNILSGGVHDDGGADYGDGGAYYFVTIWFFHVD